MRGSSRPVERSMWLDRGGLAVLEWWGGGGVQCVCFVFSLFYGRCARGCTPTGVGAVVPSVHGRFCRWGRLLYDPLCACRYYI